MQDYADWLTEERLTVEEEIWAAEKHYVRYAAAVNSLVYTNRVIHVEEFGCGTGWVPTCIDGKHITYRGFDRNAACLRLARAKNSCDYRVHFVEAEIRTELPSYNDCVCAFAVLKHFSLGELRNIFHRLFGRARCGVFTMPIAPLAYEDGTEFTHTWWDEDLLHRAITSSGLVEVCRDRTVPEEPLITVVRR